MLDDLASPASLTKRKGKRLVVKPMRLHVVRRTTLSI